MQKIRPENRIANLYVLLLMTAFPLFMTNLYHNMQSDKLYFFMYSTLICLVLVFLCILLGKFFPHLAKKGPSGEAPAPYAGYKTHAAKSAAISAPGPAALSKATPAGENPPPKKGLGAKLKLLNLNAADLFALGFLLVVGISTACSRWRFEAFWGNMGRYQGCLMWIIYIISFFLISRLYIPKKWHFCFMAAAAGIAAVWGVLDFFYMSPLNWQRDYGGDMNAFNFSSTIGNVNLLTAYEGMMLLFFSVLFIGNDEAKVKPLNGASLRSILYAAVSVVSFMGLICGLSDNALLSVAAAFCFLPFYAFRSKKSIIKYIVLFMGWAVSMAVIRFFYGLAPRTVPRSLWGNLVTLCIDHWPLTVIFFVGSVVLAIIVCGVLFICLKDVSEKKLARVLRLIWGFLGVAAALLLIYLFYDANTGGTLSIYKNYSGIFIFDNNWGTHRGYNWGLALSYFRDFPLISKLIGSGPETYSIYTLSLSYYGMLKTFSELYDSPHNEFIQYLFTTGILGFICYYGWVFCTLAKGFFKADKSRSLLGAASAFAVLTYTLVSLVNISVTVVVGVLILCLGLSSASCRPFKEEAGGGGTLSGGPKESAGGIKTKAHALKTGKSVKKGAKAEGAK